jgi:hypothetical protein
VRIRSTIRSMWRSARYQWRAWRGRCRGRAVVALVALLSLGLFEPLLCIIHCQFWMPFALQQYAAPQHHHHLMMNMGDMAGMAHASSSPLAPSAVSPAGCSLNSGHSSGVPILPPPSPVHEVVLALVPLLPVLLLIAVHLGAALTGPPRVCIPVPLRPPILVAG